MHYFFSPAEHISDKLSIQKINDEQGTVNKSCKFHYPRVRLVVIGCGHIGDILKMLRFFFKSTVMPSVDQANLVHVYSIDDKGRVYQNFKFHDPRVRLVVLHVGCCHINDIVKMLNFS